MNLCINCEHYDEGYCTSPHLWKRSMVDGKMNMIGGVNITCDHQRHSALPGIKVRDICGLEGTYFKEKK